MALKKNKPAEDAVKEAAVEEAPVEESTAIDTKEHKLAVKKVEDAAKAQKKTDDAQAKSVAKSLSDADKVGKKSRTSGKLSKGCMLINSGKYPILCRESNISFLPTIPTLIDCKPTRFMQKQVDADILKIR